MSEQPNNDPSLLFAHPGSIENLVGTVFYKKKGHSEKDRETQYHVEECGVDEFKHTHKFLALLFCAGWCPPCKTFIQILKEFYSEVNIDAKQCEVMYVPMDRSKDEYEDSYGHMSWLSIPFADHARIKSLQQRYRVVGIPNLVVVRSEDGALVTVRGRKDIHEQGVKTIADWQKTMELNKEREQNRKNEEAELEALRLKLTQLQLEKSMAIQQQMQSLTTEIGANLA